MSAASATPQIFRTIILPNSAPHHLGHAHRPRARLHRRHFGKMVVASVGVGHTMAANAFNTDLIFVGFILVGVFGLF